MERIRVGSLGSGTCSLLWKGLSANGLLLGWPVRPPSKLPFYCLGGVASAGVAFVSKIVQFVMIVIHPPAMQKSRKQRRYLMHATDLVKVLFLTPANKIGLLSMKCESETKQTAPPFSKRVDDQSAHEQPHRDPDGDLDHAVCDVEDITVDVDGGSAGRVTDRGRPIGRGAVDRLVRELVRGRQPADQTASCGEARRHLHEDGGE